MINLTVGSSNPAHVFSTVDCLHLSEQGRILGGLWGPCTSPSVTKGAPKKKKKNKERKGKEKEEKKKKINQHDEKGAQGRKLQGREIDDGGGVVRAPKLMTHWAPPSVTSWIRPC